MYLKISPLFMGIIFIVFTHMFSGLYADLSDASITINNTTSIIIPKAWEYPADRAIIPEA